MKTILIILTIGITLFTACAKKPTPTKEASNKTELTIEMFKPFLDGKHNINDVQRAFPNPDFFNAGGAFIWATYNLKDGTTLTVGEHYKAEATLKDSDGKVIKTFPFATWAETEKIKKK